MNAEGKTVTTNTLAKLATKMARIIYPFSKWLTYLSIISAAIMMLLVTADVFMRRIFNSPIYGSNDIVNILLVVIVFGAVSHVMAIRGHIVIDSITRLFPQKLQLIVTGIAQIFSMGVLLLICWRTAIHGMEMLQAGERMVLTRIPISPFLFIVAFGYALFFLVVLVQFIYTAAGVDEDTAQKLHSERANNG
jgi:TRAP-type C4-dicarboxylate transport system permease small subunit